MLNDLLIYDLFSNKIVDHIHFSEGIVPRRMYHAGFKIDDCIYSIGGQSVGGKVLNEFIEINFAQRKQKPATVEKGRNLIHAIYSHAIAPVFYQSKIEHDGTLVLSNISGDINWGEAQELIKYEGFYMFGGRTQFGEALAQLLIIQVSQDQKTNKAKFKVITAQTTGRQPPARYSHSINYLSKLSLVAIYGGRDDAIHDYSIFDDLWVIKLHSLEYVKVQIGGLVI